jgi:4-hydroxythreonine-4-phosphate dehydrogenase
MTEHTRLVITAGEPAGIGPDVVLGALQSPFDAQIAVIGDALVLEQRATALDMDLQFTPLKLDAAPPPHTPGKVSVYHIPCANPVAPGRLDRANANHVVQTLHKSVQLLKDNRFDAVVTGPVQKSVISDSGVKFTGHTEFFSEQFGCEDVVMLLVNDGLRVALATTHLPLREVSDAISQESLLRKLDIIHTELMRLYGIARPRIAMLGLNPHAGEGGHLGREEIETIMPAREEALRRGIDVTVPLPADTAFTSKPVLDADVVLAMFHDQGLPVLKSRGFGTSVNITLGLPAVRTSVDHGTALELAATGEASPQSMKAAISEAIMCAKHLNSGTGR